jgi:hypothetical protein
MNIHRKTKREKRDEWRPKENAEESRPVRVGSMHRRHVRCTFPPVRGYGYGHGLGKCEPPVKDPHWLTTEVEKRLETSAIRLLRREQQLHPTATKTGCWKRPKQPDVV